MSLRKKIAYDRHSNFLGIVTGGHKRDRITQRYAVDPFAGLLIAGEVGRWGGVAGGRRFSPFSPFSI